MDKETKTLIDFYDNKIKELEDKNKEKQDKLDEIEEYCNKDLQYGRSEDSLWLMGCYDNSKDILQIIKGEDK